MEDSAFYCHIAQAYCIVPRTRGAWVEVGYTEDYHEAKYRCTNCGSDNRKRGDEK